ncbi:MAG: beta-galactosidase trimerization domain-containing protein [Phycisphaerales bacterium]|nr:beta-galactosidase trimerization domain-containing protein [Phycisphaerales bacterium]
MQRLRFRQIHLDYHTSETIPGIGSEFDPAEFVATLRQAQVNSVTVFSRCHHGMIYHDTRFPARHPHLTCDLLTEQIRALHAADIRCPIYISVGLDEYMANAHPEWVEVKEDGGRQGPPPLRPGWRKMDLASPYLDYVIAQTAEVLDKYGDEVDGLFFDIISQHGVHSKWCLAEFDRLGRDPASPADQAWRRRHLVTQYTRRMTDAVRAKNQRCLIFHNSGHIYPWWRDLLDCYSHLEIESLPSGGWGYAHFPVTMRYARGLGLDALAMTGRFAKTWGHFSSYKTQASLDYECFNALAHGAKCSVGDQLHPRGRLDAATYQLIGRSYAEVARKEAWCEEVEPLTEVAVFNVEAVGREDARVDSSALGAYRMLVEDRQQFDFVDSQHDWSPYRVLILPDKVTCDESLAARLDAYVAAGGAVISSAESGLDAAGQRYLPAALPADHAGLLPYHPDFVRPAAELAGGLLPTEYVMYERGQRLVPRPDSHDLGELWVPYFNREWRHFCSHHHTPVDQRSADPAILQRGRWIHFAHPVFACFSKHGMVFYKQVVLNALRRLLPEPLLLADGPSTLHATWNRQPGARRSIVHLLHYIPERRTQGADYLEDVIPLHDVTLRLRTAPPSRVYLAPDGTELAWRQESGRLVVTVPRVDGHAMVVLDD